MIWPFSALINKWKKEDPTFAHMLDSREKLDKNDPLSPFLEDYEDAYQKLHKASQERAERKRMKRRDQ